MAEHRDMSEYTTKNTMYWMTGIIIGAVLAAVSGGYSMTAAHVEGVVQEHNKHPHDNAVDVRVFSALNGAQNKVVQGLSKRVIKTEDEVDQNHEMIKNVETRLTGIETALEFLVDEAKKK